MPTDGKLTEYDYRVVAFVEEYFWDHQKAPGLAQVSEFSERTVEDLNEFFIDPTVQEYLLSRNIPSPGDDIEEARGLTAHQLYVANILLNAHDRRSLREKLKAAQISSQKYNAWMNDDRFTRYIQKRCERLFNVSEWQVRQSLVNNAADGDTAAQKLYFQLTGKLVEKHEHSINITGILSQIPELVARYIPMEIRDRAMGELANDIEYLLQTGQLPVDVDMMGVLELGAGSVREG